MNSELNNNQRDRLVSVAKAVAGGLPFVGNLISEVLDNVVPELRFERAIIFLTELDTRVQKLEGKKAFEHNLSSENGVDILEEGIIQASRSVSKERKERLANLVSNSLTQNDLRYEEARKLLNIYSNLTDPEIIWLIYFSLNPTIGDGPHKDWFKQHKKILSPVRNALNLPVEEQERAALQESYKSTLLSLGLARKKGSITSITTLGRMLVSYIFEVTPKDDDK